MDILNLEKNLTDSIGWFPYGVNYLDRNPQHHGLKKYYDMLRN